MDSESPTSSTWFVRLKEAANKRMLAPPPIRTKFVYIHLVPRPPPCVFIAATGNSYGRLLQKIVRNFSGRIVRDTEDAPIPEVLLVLWCARSKSPVHGTLVPMLNHNIFCQWKRVSGVAGAKTDSLGTIADWTDKPGTNQYRYITDGQAVGFTRFMSPLIIQAALKTSSDVSVWCSFFHANTDLASIHKSELMLPRMPMRFGSYSMLMSQKLPILKCMSINTKKQSRTSSMKNRMVRDFSPVSLKICKITPKLPSTLISSFGMVTPSVAITPFCRSTFSPLVLTNTVIAPSDRLPCYSPNKVGMTLAATGPATANRLPNMVTPKSVLTLRITPCFKTGYSPKMAESPTLISEARQVSVITPTVALACKVRMVVSSIETSMIKPTLQHISADRSGFASLVLATADQMSSVAQVFIAVVVDAMANSPVHVPTVRPMSLVSKVAVEFPETRHVVTQMLKGLLLLVSKARQESASDILPKFIVGMVFESTITRVMPPALMSADCQILPYMVLLLKMEPHVPKAVARAVVIPVKSPISSDLPTQLSTVCATFASKRLPASIQSSGLRSAVIPSLLSAATEMHHVQMTTCMVSPFRLKSLMSTARKDALYVAVPSRIDVPPRMLISSVLPSSCHMVLYKHVVIELSVFKHHKDTKPATRNVPRMLTCTRQQKKFDGYDHETFQIFRQIEEKYQCDPTYLDRQSLINSDMRSKLISWMAQVADVVKLSHGALVLSVNILDRFMSVCRTTKDNLQLVAVTCMLIAGKFEQGDDTAFVEDYVYLTANTYISDQIVTLEKLILEKLGWNLFVPTAAWFGSELLAVCKADDKLKHMTMFLTEMTMQDTQYLSIRPSIIAAASLSLARLNLGLPAWTRELSERSGYCMKDFSLCMKLISETCTLYRTLEEVSHQGVLMKYSTEKYQCVADAIRDPEQLPYKLQTVMDNNNVVNVCDVISPSMTCSIKDRTVSFIGDDTSHRYHQDFGDPGNKKRKPFEGYNVETYRIMRDSEDKHRADPDYMWNQTCITNDKRRLAVNWMMYVADVGSFPASFLLLAVNLMDRFLSLCDVQNEKLNLVAVACLFIATKYELRVEGIDMFVNAAFNKFSKEQIIGMEKLVLTKLDFHLAVPNAAWFCYELLQVCDADNELSSLTLYLTELTTLDVLHVEYRPSEIAAAALCLARYSLGLAPWTKMLYERSEYEILDFLDCLRNIYEDYKLSQDQECVLQLKYRKEIYSMVSDFDKYPVPDIDGLLDQCYKELE